MKKIITRGLFLALLIGSGVAIAEPHDMSGMKMMSHDMGKPMQMVDGEVKKIRKSSGKVTLKHGEIIDVMPAMTMSYKLRDKTWLQNLHVGDKVKFALEKEGDDFVVTHLKVVR